MVPGGVGSVSFLFSGVQYGVVHHQVGVGICIHVHLAYFCPMGSWVEAAVIVRIVAGEFYAGQAQGAVSFAGEAQGKGNISMFCYE